LTVNMGDRFISLTVPKKVHVCNSLTVPARLDNASHAPAESGVGIGISKTTDAQSGGARIGWKGLENATAEPHNVDVFERLD
ncbi:MAG: hypothetical protein WAO12_04695, partial [Venatoribacter sp.]